MIECLGTGQQGGHFFGRGIDTETAHDGRYPCLDEFFDPYFRRLEVIATFAATANEVLMGIDKPRYDHASAGIDMIHLRTEVVDDPTVHSTNRCDDATGGKDVLPPYWVGPIDVAAFNQCQ